MPIFIAIEQREQNFYFVYLCRWGGGGGGSQNELNRVVIKRYMVKTVSPGLPVHGSPSLNRSFDQLQSMTTDLPGDVGGPPRSGCGGIPLIERPDLLHQVHWAARCIPHLPRHLSPLPFCLTNISPLLVQKLPPSLHIRLLVFVVQTLRENHVLI